MTLGRGKHFQVAAATTSEAHLAFMDKSAVWCKFDFLDPADPVLSSLDTNHYKLSCSFEATSQSRL